MPSPYIDVSKLPATMRKIFSVICKMRSIEAEPSRIRLSDDYASRLCGEYHIDEQELYNHTTVDGIPFSRDSQLQTFKVDAK